MDYFKLKEKYKHIDDPLFAIAFCVDCLESEAISFLNAWQHGEWNEIKTSWPNYLERCK